MKLWGIIESECHKLDLELALLASGKEGDRAGFLKYTQLIEEIHDLTDEKHRLTHFASMLDGAVTALALVVLFGRRTREFSTSLVATAWLSGLENLSLPNKTILLLQTVIQQKFLEPGCRILRHFHLLHAPSKIFSSITQGPINLANNILHVKTCTKVSVII